MRAFAKKDRMILNENGCKMLEFTNEGLDATVSDHGLCHLVETSDVCADNIVVF